METDYRVASAMSPGLVRQKALLAQFLAFSGVGAVGTAAHYGVLLVLVEWGSRSAMLATTVGFGVGAGVNYVLSRRIVFRSTVPFGRGLLKFLLIAVIGASLNASLVGALAGQLAVHYLLAQVVATGVVLVFNYAANRFWTFREISGESR